MRIASIVRIAAVSGALLPAAARADCASFTFLDIPFEACAQDDGMTLNVDGKTVADADYRVNAVGTKTYHIDMQAGPRAPLGAYNPSQDFKLTLEWNSAGDWKDKVILELCVHDPTFVRFGFGNTQIGQQQCGNWIPLMDIRFPS